MGYELPVWMQKNNKNPQLIKPLLCSNSKPITHNP